MNELVVVGVNINLYLIIPKEPNTSGESMGLNAMRVRISGSLDDFYGMVAGDSRFHDYGDRRAGVGQI